VNSRTVRAAIVTITVLAATLVAAVAAPADESGGECFNAPTVGLELRSPYLPAEGEQALRDGYSIFEQPADTQHHYLIYVPSSIGDAPVPLVVTMHGLGGSAKQHVAQTRWQETADEHGFVLVAPNGHRTWDYADGSVDEGYLRDVVADVRARNCLDERRLYVTGHSNGGFMTHRATCDLGDLFAAGASYAAGDLTNRGPCTPGLDPAGEPVPGWERMSLGTWHGTDDAVVGYGAGRRGMAKWLDRYDCDTTPVTVADEFGDTDTWGACLDGVTLRFRTLDGHGHAWPDGCGGAQSTGGSVECTPEQGTGPWPGPTDLTKEIWAFLSQFEREAPAVDQTAAALPGPSRQPTAPTAEGVLADPAGDGIESGVDTVATFRRTAPLVAGDSGLAVELVFRAEYGGDGAGLGDSHPACPTSNPGPGTQSMENRVVTVSAEDRDGDIVSLDVVTEPFVTQRPDGGEDHEELVQIVLPGDFDPDHTVLRARFAGDLVKFWFGCGTSAASYKETIRTAQ